MVTAKRPVEVMDVTNKIAGALGTNAQQLMINDLAVNLSGREAIYLSVLGGRRGPDAMPPSFERLTPRAKPIEVPPGERRAPQGGLPNPPAADKRQRNESITDIAFVDGRVLLAGLSNEEFSSKLISIPYPFGSEGIDGAAIEIYHGSHAKFETTSPIRTFVTYKIQNEPYMLAAYTCTPLVKVPVSDLKAGAHVKGTTIAELGNHNRPIDMIVYQKDGKDYLFMTNNSRGVMKIPTEGVGSAPPITTRVPDKQGIGYETIASLKGAEQMDQLDDQHAVLLIKDSNGSMNLKTVELP